MAAKTRAIPDRAVSSFTALFTFICIAAVCPTIHGIGDQTDMEFSNDDDRSLTRVFSKGSRRRCFRVFGRRVGYLDLDCPKGKD